MQMQTQATPIPLNPPGIDGRSRLGKPRLLFRYLRFGLRSARSGYWDFVGDAAKASALLVGTWLRDGISGDKRVSCNLCGWEGEAFYPNAGPGYFEPNTTCPGCLCQDRHRSLAMILDATTDFFAPDRRVIEVAPMRRFQEYCLARKAGGNYRSFDFERFAMERGDITAMHYQDEACDFFLCFHVLEHIMDERKALAEIHRVLAPGGAAVLQVPLDWNLPETYEYGKPDPRETNHVRRYGTDFADRLRHAGFRVTRHEVGEFRSATEIRRHGLSVEPVFFAWK